MSKFTLCRKKHLLYCFLRGATALRLGDSCAIKLNKSVFSYNFHEIAQFRALINCLLSQNVSEAR